MPEEDQLLTPQTAVEGRGSRFLSAFNEIEDHFRRALRYDTPVEFWRLASEYAEQEHLPPDHRASLDAFARLRNATAFTTTANQLPNPWRLWSDRSKGFVIKYWLRRWQSQC